MCVCGVGTHAMFVTMRQHNISSSAMNYHQKKYYRDNYLLARPERQLVVVGRGSVFEV